MCSPDGLLAVAVTLDPDGRPGYAIARRGAPVIAESRLGFILANAPKLEREFSLAGSERRSTDDTWEQPWGERRFVRDHDNELRVPLARRRAMWPPARCVSASSMTASGSATSSRIRPLTDVEITEELTEFAVAEPATAWWIPGGEWNRYEYLYHRTPLAEVGQAHTPITMRTASGLHIAFHEAALVDYAAMWLRRSDGASALKAVLSPSAVGPRVVRQAPFTTPWRTLQIATDAPGLVHVRSHPEPQRAEQAR